MVLNQKLTALTECQNYRKASLVFLNQPVGWQLMCVWVSKAKLTEKKKIIINKHSKISTSERDCIIVARVEVSLLDMNETMTAPSPDSNMPVQAA